MEQLVVFILQYGTFACRNGNFDENLVEELNAANHPKDESMGSRKIPFSREIYVEQHDFQEVLMLLEDEYLIS